MDLGERVVIKHFLVQFPVSPVPLSIRQPATGVSRLGIPAFILVQTWALYG